MSNSLLRDIFIYSRQECQKHCLMLHFQSNLKGYSPLRSFLVFGRSFLELVCFQLLHNIPNTLFIIIIIYLTGPICCIIDYPTFTFHWKWNQIASFFILPGMMKCLYSKCSIVVFQDSSDKSFDLLKVECKMKKYFRRLNHKINRSAH